MRPETVAVRLVEDNKGENTLGSAERDLVALGIAVSAIMMFVATGGSVLPRVMDAIVGNGDGPDNLLVNALLLNIALVIFGWRRYRQLREEIDHRRVAEAQARQLAEIDPLSGCLNRRSMKGATDDLRIDANSRGLALAYVMIDLDNFKQINDMHTHSIGDKLLVSFVQRIRKKLAKGALLARLGGDEFSYVVSYDPHQPDQVDEQVARLIEAMSRPFQIERKEIMP